MLEYFRVEQLTKDILLQLHNKYKFEFVIVSSVKQDSADWNDFAFKTLALDSSVSLPFKNLYQTPHTLGKDRIAAVAGAMQRFGSNNTLIIDAGTCIKYDYINSKNEYSGGAISPGINMRFKALNAFTDQLPLIEAKETFTLVGKSTEGSILSGVLNGVLAEAEGIILKYETLYSDLKVILTGGDMLFFEKGLKNTIFADPFLTLKGLNFILKHNVPQQFND